MFSQWGLETENAKNTPELSLTVVCENAPRSSTRTSSAFGIQEREMWWIIIFFSVKESLHFFFSCRKVFTRPSPILLKGRRKLCDLPTRTWGPGSASSFLPPSAILTMARLSFVWASSLFSWSPWCHISQTNGCPALCLSFKNWKIIQRFLLQLLLHLLNHHILLHPPLLLCAGQPLRHCLLVCCYDTNLNTNQPKSWEFYSHCFWLFVLQPVPTSQDFSDWQTWQRHSCSCCWSDSNFQPSALHDPLLVLELLLTAHWVSAHHASTKPPISVKTKHSPISVKEK